MDFTASLTMTTPAEPEDLLEELSAYHPAVNDSPLHPQAFEVVTTYPATSLTQALATAQALATQIASDHAGTTLRGLEVVATQDWDHREEQVPDDVELIGVTEAAQRLGVSPQAVRERLDRGTLHGLKVGHSWVMTAHAVKGTTRVKRVRSATH